MASDPGTAGSVFDILYSDTRRLSSLLSQFSDDGLAIELIRGAEDTSTTQLGLSVKVLKADGSESGKTSKTTRFDPKWLLPLLFLENSQDMIQHDIGEAPVGSLVLATGRLIITDISILKGMWESAKMKQYILDRLDSEASQDESNRHDRRAAAKKPGQKKPVSDNELGLEIMPILPHTPQMNIVTPDHTVWATIDPESLFGTVGDLTLKHGSKIAGSWSVVGILDARPFEMHEDDADHDYDDILSGMDRVRIGMTLDNIWKVATELAGPAREALGRPIMSYGITPLIIFREIETQPKPRPVATASPNGGPIE